MQGEPSKARFSGSYQIERKLSEVNYLTGTPDRRKTHRVCHANMLKRYFDREGEQKQEICMVITQPNPDDSEFDIPQIKLDNEDVIKNWDKLPPKGESK